MPATLSGSGIRITSQATGAVIVDVLPDGTVRCGRMPYKNKRDGRTSIRHIMETGEAGESVMETLNTGLPHEAARNAANFSFSLCSPKPILIEFGPDEKNPGGTHMKVFFAVIVKGELRNFVLPDGDEELGPITMVDIKDLIEETEDRTIPIHFRATKAALASFAGNRLVFNRYESLIGNWQQPVLTDEELAAIEAYSGKW